MATQRLGIIMHGITGRMGYNQHLVRSICAIRDQGGVALANGDRVMPDPVLIGRKHWSGVRKVAVGDRGARDYLREREVVRVECGDIGDGRDVDLPT